jgi:hypothetical protein
MSERHSKICETLTNLTIKLDVPLKEISLIDAQLADLIQKERVLREKSEIVDGKRTLSDVDALVLKEYKSKINRCIRQKAKIKKDHKDDFDKYMTFG